MPYTEAHKLFLQSLISRRIVSEATAKKIYKKAFEITGEQREDFQKFVTDIKNALNQLDLDVRQTNDELTGKVYLTLVNQRSDEVAQLASDYSPLEIAYFRLIVERIMTAPGNAFSTSSISALREAGNVKGTLTKSAAEALLNSWVARKWLVLSNRGRYSLGTRALTELESYLKNQYDECDLRDCVFDTTLVTKGFGCSHEGCQAAMHQHAAEKYFANPNNANCPSCRQPWAPYSIGESAVAEHGAASPPPRRSGGERRHSGTQEEEEEIDEDEDEENEDSLPTPGARRQSTRNAGARKKRVADDDDDDDMQGEDEVSRD